MAHFQQDDLHEEDAVSSQEEDVAEESDTPTDIDSDADIGPYLLARSVTEGKWTQLDEYVKSVVTKLRRREIAGSSAAAAQTAELLRTVVSRGSFHSVSTCTCTHVSVSLPLPLSLELS
jgi:hypothetical protein